MARVSIPQAENDCLQSEAMATAPWGAGTGVTCSDNTSDVADPLGGNTATKMVYDGSGVAGSFMLFQVFNAMGVVGDMNAAAVWVRLATGSVNVNITTDNAQLTGQIVGTSWVRLVQIATSTFGTARLLGVYRDNADNAARTFYLAFAQAVAGKNRLGPYAKTTVSPVVGPIRNVVSGRVPVLGRVAASGRVTP